MNNENVIRILNIVPNMRAAGIESFIMNVYRNIDRNKIQFDFLVHSQKREFYDDEIEKLGGKIYRLSLKDDKNILKYLKDLNTFFEKHKEYQIIHGHMQSMMPLYLFIAKKNKVKTRIAHSHNSSYEKTIKGIILHIFSRLSKYNSTLNIACSYNSGKYLFSNKKFIVIYNGVDASKFNYDPRKRKKFRNELNFEEEFVIGHIGRFELQKNHSFIIKIFQECKKNIKNCKLILVGEGKYESHIKEKVKEFNLENDVKFLGLRKDTDYIYNGIDCFILPSLYEGFPVVGVESQFSGVPSIFSNKITDEVKISKNTKFINIQNPNEWSNEIYKLYKSKDKRKCSIKSEFEIKTIAMKLMEIYENEK